MRRNASRTSAIACLCFEQRDAYASVICDVSGYVGDAAVFERDAPVRLQTFNLAYFAEQEAGACPRATDKHGVVFDDDTKAQRVGQGVEGENRDGAADREDRGLQPGDARLFMEKPAAGDDDREESDPHDVRGPRGAAFDGVGRLSVHDAW